MQLSAVSYSEGGVQNPSELEWREYLIPNAKYGLRHETALRYLEFCTNVRKDSDRSKLNIFVRVNTELLYIN